jgi:hypothetical protein
LSHSFAKRLSEREKALSGPLEAVKSDNKNLTARLLLPSIKSRLLLQNPEIQLQSISKIGEDIDSILDQMNTTTSDLKSSDLGDDEVCKFTLSEINPALMVLASGIGIHEDGAECCYTPMPPINRRLDGGRLKGLHKEQGLIDNFLGCGIVDRHTHSYSLYPFSILKTGSEEESMRLTDLAASEEKWLAGNPRSNGLQKCSVKNLWNAFVSKPMPEQMEQGLENAYTRMVVVHLILGRICKKFDNFSSKPCFEAILCHLLHVLNDKNGTEGEITQETLHCHCLADVVLLIKVLWVGLEFPILGTLEGSARLYCANRVLLDVGLEGRSEKRGALEEKLPDVMTGTTAPVYLYATEKGFSSFPLAWQLQECALRLQGAIDFSDPVTLCGFLPDLCEMVAMGKEAQLAICKRDNSQGLIDACRDYQKEPLVKILERLSTSNQFFKNMLGNAKLENLKQLGPHTINSRHSTRVTYFAILYGLMKIELKAQNIRCTSPHLALKNFLIANGNLQRQPKTMQDFNGFQLIQMASTPTTTLPSRS